MAEGNESKIESHEATLNHCKARAIRLVDITLACAVLAPLVVTYWRTTWLLMDMYIYPHHYVFSACICTAIGYISSLLIVLCQRDFITWLSECNTIVSAIVWRVCLYPMSLSCVIYWRGVWMLTDYTATMTVTSYVLCHLLSFVFLFLLNAACSVASTPLFFIHDRHVSPSTVNNTPWASDKYTLIKYILTCFLTVSLVGLAVVVYWRGTWMLLDYITDSNTHSSLSYHALSYGVTSCVTIVCYMISRPCETFLINSTTCPQWLKVALEHVFVYVIGCCSVNMWRSVWYIWDGLFLSGSPVEAALLSHVVSLVALYVGQAASNLSGAPIACRTHGSTSLEGLYMGSYLTITQPLTKPNQ